MSVASLLQYRWLGDKMVPLDRCLSLARQQFEDGEVYTLQRGRSDKSHSHEFAWLHDAWQSLPEDIADEYPTIEHLRKRALIQAGFYDEEILDIGSKAGAERMYRREKARDDFALVILRGNYVVVRTAKSQSRRAMGGADFQASKTAIMEIIAGMISVAPDALAKEGDTV